METLTGQIEYPDQSQKIGEIALALSQAQADITGARKGSVNPFFHSSYADLASCWDACREALAKHKLAVIQTLDNDGDKIVVITTLAHESGQWIRSRISGKPVKNDPQGMGSAITYFRRYSLSAIVGIAQVDDDGNAASNGKKDVRVVTSGQAQKIEAMVVDTESDVTAFLKFAGSETFETIPANRFQACIAALEAKLKVVA